MNQRGSGLIGAIVGIGIAGLMMAAIVSMIDNANRETRSIAEKLEILQLQQRVTGDLADSTVCGCHFDPAKNSSNGAPLAFDSGNLANASVQLSRLYSGCSGGLVSSPSVVVGQPLPGGSGHLRVSTIRLAGIESTGSPGAYRGNLTVEFDSTQTVLARRPPNVAVNFRADLTNPSAAQITSCSSSGATGGSASVPKCHYTKYSYQYSSFTGDTTPTHCSTTGGLRSPFTCRCPTGQSLMTCLAVNNGAATSDIIPQQNADSCTTWVSAGSGIAGINRVADVAMLCCDN